MSQIKPIELLEKRFSPRAYKNLAIPSEVLKSLFSAASLSPSAFNDQPWVFFVATKDEPAEYEKIASLLVEPNRIWASQAPVIVLVAARTTFARDGISNPYAAYDTGGAVAHLTTQASSLDVYIHQMAGFDHAKAVEVFELPDNFQPLTILAVGYLADEMNTQAVKEEILAKRSRAELSGIVFSGKLGTAFKF
jgi:nitroreductase